MKLSWMLLALLIIAVHLNTVESGRRNSVQKDKTAGAVSPADEITGSEGQVAPDGSEGYKRPKPNPHQENSTKGSGNQGQPQTSQGSQNQTGPQRGNGNQPGGQQGGNRATNQQRFGR